MSRSELQILDTTLRDGNHAVGHQISRQQIERYSALADQAGVDMIEVGHGNGLGASSVQVGVARESDEVMLEAARANVRRAQLTTLALPGFATRDQHLSAAVACGVDIIRLGAHCTEADLTSQHVAFVRENGLEAQGVLMMAHWAEPSVLLEQAHLMVDYGAQAIILMDSAGTFRPVDVKERIGVLADGLDVPIGFHAHNNLQLAIANAMTAVDAGASILDASVRGFGAGAGNAPLEVLVAALSDAELSRRIDLYRILDLADFAEHELIERPPGIESVNIVSGLNAVFSGFSKHVIRESDRYGVDPRDILKILGERRVVAGQEDVVIDVARELSGSEALADSGSV